MPRASCSACSRAVPRSTTRLTSPMRKASFGNDGIAREQHLHGMLASGIAREGDHRCRAEQADVHAGRAEFGSGRSDREVAGRHQLTAGGGGCSLHRGNERLRQAQHGKHHGAAAVHEPLRVASATIGIRAVGRQLLEIVTRRERGSSSSEHNGAHALIGRDFRKCLLQAASMSSDRALRNCGRSIVRTAILPMRSSRRGGDSVAAAAGAAAGGGYGFYHADDGSVRVRSFINKADARFFWHRDPTKSSRRRERPNVS